MTKEESNFRKTLKRDAILILSIGMITAIGIVLIAYYSVKHGW